MTVKDDKPQLPEGILDSFKGSSEDEEKNAFRAAVNSLINISNDSEVDSKDRIEAAKTATTALVNKSMVDTLSSHTDNADKNMKKVLDNIDRIDPDRRM
jgi:hypothetical protein